MVALQSNLQTFSDFGSSTEVTTRQVDSHSVPTFLNEFWTSKQRDAHSLHEVSYRACYKPQLPAFFIERTCQPGDIVYDPFMGRGTTLVEARLHGCQVIGNDANPLSQILCAPRLNPPTLEQVRSRLDEITLPQPTSLNQDLLTFFHPNTLTELHGWRDYFSRRKAENTFDPTDAWLQMVATNRLTGHSKGFFSVYTLPPNQATSLEAQKRINTKRNQTPEYRDTKTLILKKSKSLLRHPLPKNFNSSKSLLLTNSADHTPEIPANSVQLVVTSPPFLDIVDYVGDNWLRNWFCQVDPDPKAIWQLRSIEDWTARMTGVFHELHRILKPGGLIAFEVGEVRNGTVPLEDEVVRAALPSGLQPEAIMINAQNFTKTANCWGVANNSKGTNTNRIVLLRKT
ncbi:MAG: DNA methyltransferase [Verrucomicrobiota bacterium]